MSARHLLVHLAYVLPLAGLAWLALRHRSGRGATLFLLCLPAFYVLHYETTRWLSGWPATAPLPDRFELLEVRINEPGGRLDGEGSIYLWILEQGQEQPRGYAVAYSRQLHRQLQAAGERIAAGHPQVGQRIRPSPANAGTGSASAQQSVPGEFSFEDAPLRRLPGKPGAD